MWTAIFERSVTDHVALVVHIYLLGGATLATIMVGAGIIWENGPLQVHNIAHRLVIWGVVAETLCSVTLFAFDEGISKAQQSKIIALQTQIAPRSLTKEQYDAIQALKGRIPAINLAVKDDSESKLFAATLASALMNAEIKVRGYGLPPDMHFSSGLVVYDQHIFSDDSAGKIIFESLSNGGLTARIKSSRLPDALDMPRDIPAILVYEKLYTVPGSDSYFVPPADQASPTPVK